MKVKAMMFSPSIKYIDASIDAINLAIIKLTEAKSDLIKMRHKITINFYRTG